MPTHSAVYGPYGGLVSILMSWGAGVEVGGDKYRGNRK